jgi:PPOX class probable F420-dependent enzyme
MASQIDEGGKAILEKPTYVTVSTLRKDGSVHTVVTWVHVEGDRIALNTAEGRLWRRNVARDPRVTITAIEPDNPYNWISIRGRIVEDTHDGADAHIDMLAKKYMGVDEYPFRNADEQRVKLLVEPEHVTHFTPPS